MKKSLFLALALSACSVAEEKSITVPKNSTERISFQNLSLTSETLFNAYMSDSVEQRRFAELYVLGVIDSTEGTIWCGFEVASPAAIQEQVYLSLKAASHNTPKSRASSAITLRLKELLPCMDLQ